MTICFLLTACGTGGTAAQDPAAVQDIIAEELSVLITGIEREDPLLASQPVSELFEMGSNVAIRYDETAWVEDATNGISKFRTFFALVFDKNANIDQTLEPTAFELLGDVATLTVNSEFSAVRVDKAPPENVSATGNDVMVFERVAGRWLLVRWDDVAPDPEPEPEPEPEPVE